MLATTRPEPIVMSQRVTVDKPGWWFIALLFSNYLFVKILIPKFFLLNPITKVIPGKYCFPVILVAFYRCQLPVIA